MELEKYIMEVKKNLLIEFAINYAITNFINNKKNFWIEIKELDKIYYIHFRESINKKEINSAILIYSEKSALDTCNMINHIDHPLQLLKLIKFLNISNFDYLFINNFNGLNLCSYTQEISSFEIKGIKSDQIFKFVDKSILDLYLSDKLLEQAFNDNYNINRHEIKTELEKIYILSYNGDILKLTSKIQNKISDYFNIKDTDLIKTGYMILQTHIKNKLFNTFDILNYNLIESLIEDTVLNNINNLPIFTKLNINNDKLCFIDNYLKTNKELLFYGKEKTGKTNIICDYAKKKYTRILYFDLTDDITFNSTIRFIEETINIKLNSELDIIEIFKNLNTIFIFDNYEENFNLCSFLFYDYTYKKALKMYNKAIKINNNKNTFIFISKINQPTLKKIKSIKNELLSKENIYKYFKKTYKNLPPKKNIVYLIDKLYPSIDLITKAIVLIQIKDINYNDLNMDNIIDDIL